MILIVVIWSGSDDKASNNGYTGTFGEWEEGVSGVSTLKFSRNPLTGSGMIKQLFLLLTTLKSETD